MIRKQISVNNERGCAQIVRICDRVIDLCSKYNHPDAAHTCRGHPPQLLAQEHRDHICKQLLASAADMKQAVGLWSGAPIDIFASGMEQKSRVFLAVCRTHLETLDNIQDLMTKHCRCQVAVMLIPIDLDQIMNVLQNSHERSSASTAPRPPVASSALPRQGDMQVRSNIYFRPSCRKNIVRNHYRTGARKYK